MIIEITSLFIRTCYLLWYAFLTLIICGKPISVSNFAEIPLELERFQETSRKYENIFLHFISRQNKNKKMGKKYSSKLLVKFICHLIWYQNGNKKTEMCQTSYGEVPQYFSVDMTSTVSPPSWSALPSLPAQLRPPKSLSQTCMPITCTPANNA